MYTTRTFAIITFILSFAIPASAQSNADTVTTIIATMVTEDGEPLRLIHETDESSIPLGYNDACGRSNSVTYKRAKGNTTFCFGKVNVERDGSKINTVNSFREETVTALDLDWTFSVSTNLPQMLRTSLRSNTVTFNVDQLNHDLRLVTTSIAGYAWAGDIDSNDIVPGKKNRIRVTMHRLPVITIVSPISFRAVHPTGDEGPLEASANSVVDHQDDVELVRATDGQRYYGEHYYDRYVLTRGLYCYQEGAKVGVLQMMDSNGQPITNGDHPHSTVFVPHHFKLKMTGIIDPLQKSSAGCVSLRYGDDITITVTDKGAFSQTIY